MILYRNTFSVVCKRPDFDFACREAFQAAVLHLEIDDNGHSKKIQGWDRANGSFTLEFKSYKVSGGMEGAEHRYMFKLIAEKLEE